MTGHIPRRHRQFRAQGVAQARPYPLIVTSGDALRAWQSPRDERTAQLRATYEAALSAAMRPTGRHIYAPSGLDEFKGDQP